MRPHPSWSLLLGVVSLWSLVAWPHSLRPTAAALGLMAVDTRAAPGTDPTMPDTLRQQLRLPMDPTISAPPEDPQVSACRTVGFQTE